MFRNGALRLGLCFMAGHAERLAFREFGVPAWNRPSPDPVRGYVAPDLTVRGFLHRNITTLGTTFQYWKHHLTQEFPAIHEE